MVEVSNATPAATAAVRQNQDVELICCFGCQQSLANRRAGGLGREIGLERTSVDRDFPFARPQEHPRHRSLPAARA